MLRVCTEASKTDRQTVLLTCNTKYFISLLQKLIDLRAMVAGLNNNNEECQKSIRLSQIISVSCYLIPFTA